MLHVLSYIMAVSCAVGDVLCIIVHCNLYKDTVTEVFAGTFIVICMLVLSLNGKSDVIVEVKQQLIFDDVQLNEMVSFQD